jgi:hypothetical protein
MLSVTVMMLRLIVESVMLLNEEDWRGDRAETGDLQSHMLLV